jgi:DoxX-like family
MNITVKPLVAAPIEKVWKASTTPAGIMQARRIPMNTKTTIWAGRVMSGLPALFLLVDAGMKLLRLPVVVEATVQLGYPDSSVIAIGAVLLACTLLYIVPRTSVLGAILLTGYLGGAIATHVRVGAPLFNYVFAVGFGALLWGGLWLRDARLRALIPLAGRD